MPLGSPLPPPPRLSWPGPRCLPRTIMPPTAAGTEIRVAAAGGPASRGGPRPAASSSGRCVARGNREPGHGRLLVRAPLHEPTSKVPAAGLSPPSWAWAAGPPERRGRDGEAGSCPSFLPLKSKSSAPRGTQAAAPAGFAVSRYAAAIRLSSARGDSISVSPQSSRAPRIRRPRVVDSEGERGVAEADPGPDSCHVCQPATSERPLSN